MATSVTAPLLNEDDEDKKPQKRKELYQKPLRGDELKDQLVKDRATNELLLAELSKKTAELAEQVKGKDTPEDRVLKLDEPDDEEPKDIFEKLDKISESEMAEPEPKKSSDVNAAVDLIRNKLNNLYVKEPDTAEEAAESIEAGSHRSKHQQFMYDLTTSGKSLADIQTQWHNYYVELPNEEKHEVWQEFYRDQESTSQYVKALNREGTNRNNRSKKLVQGTTKASPNAPETRSIAEIKNQLMNKVTAGGRLKPIHHIKSALFGLGLAGIVGLLVTFTLFNEVFIAPFISPSRSVSATPIIGDVEGPVGPEPKIIIPKINLEVPVVYGGITDENAIQKALEEGVVHYGGSPTPGQQGNVVIVGHSSNNILNAGKYKFAFVLLKRLEVEDTFFVHKDGVRYTYKIYEKKIVKPEDTSVLGPAQKPNSITLITCDPPGTSLNRLIVVAEQITPDPLANIAPTIEVDQAPPAELPSNAPSLWSRLTGWL